MYQARLLPLLADGHSSKCDCSLAYATSLATGRGVDARDKSVERHAQRTRTGKGGCRKTGGQSARAASRGAGKKLENLRQQRQERVGDGGRRIVIEEPDKRRIIREEGKTIIRHDETERFQRSYGDVRTERRGDVNVKVVVRPGGVRIFTLLGNCYRELLLCVAVAVIETIFVSMAYGIE